jgi:O-antigen ligase
VVIMANGGSTVVLDRSHLIPLAGVFLLATVAAMVRPESLSAVVLGVVGLVVLALRPEWGVGLVLTMLMVQYRNRYFWLSQWLPSGQGLLSINNVLGLVLATIMAFRLYRDRDWSFLRNRTVQLVLAVTGAIVVSALIHPLNYQEVIALGLRPPNQDPVRLIVSRALFVFLVVFFCRAPRQVRFLVGVYIALSLMTAYAASMSALSGEGWEGGVGARVQETYRAGGSAAFTRIAGNPNRLAMVATLLIVLMWEFGQSVRGRRWILLSSVTILGLVLTVFLTASRGGMLGLAVTGLLLLAHQRGEARRLVYSAMVVLLAAGLVSQVVPEQALERLRNVPGFGDGGAGAGSVERRSYTLGIAFELGLRDPILGIGVGNWEKERFLIDPLHSTAVPHNSYMLALVEGGVVTLALYLLLFRHTIRRLAELARNPVVMQRAGREGLDWLISGMRLCLLSFMVFSLFADLWETINFYLLIGVAAALIQRYDQRLLQPRAA